MNILRIDAAARDGGSISRELTDQFVAGLEGTGTVVTRDLTEPLPHVDSVWVEATNTPPDARTDAHKAALALSDRLVDEIEQADLLVIGLPVYNFGVPASLKAWIDLICRVGRTFSYTAEGPLGLVKGKRAVVIYVSGGTPIGSDIDFASGYLRHVLGFIGIDDVEFVAADGHLMDPQAQARATTRLGELAPSYTGAAA